MFYILKQCNIYLVRGTKFAGCWVLVSGVLIQDPTFNVALAGSPLFNRCTGKLHLAFGNIFWMLCGSCVEPMFQFSFVHVKFLLRFLHVGRLAQIGKDSRESCTNCRRLSAALQSTHQHLVQAFLSWREGLWWSCVCSWRAMMYYLQSPGVV